MSSVRSPHSIPDMCTPRPDRHTNFSLSASELRGVTATWWVERCGRSHHIMGRSFQFFIPSSAVHSTHQHRCALVVYMSLPSLKYIVCWPHYRGVHSYTSVMAQLLSFLALCLLLMTTRVVATDLQDKGTISIAASWRVSYTDSVDRHSSSIAPPGCVNRTIW